MEQTAQEKLQIQHGAGAASDYTLHVRSTAAGVADLFCVDAAFAIVISEIPTGVKVTSRIGATPRRVEGRYLHENRDPSGRPNIG